MEDITVLISTSPLELTFHDIVSEIYNDPISDANKVQLNLLTQKHCSQYCLFIGIEICQYQSEGSVEGILNNYQSEKTEKDFKYDFQIFFKRFLYWDDERINDFFEKLVNVLRNIFINQLLVLTGMDLYDNRKFTLRSFKYSREHSTAGERILLVSFKRKEISTLGSSVVI